MTLFPRDLALELLERAGITDHIVSWHMLPGGWTNDNWKITLESGRELLFRHYRRPFEHSDFDRPVKERHLHRILAEAGVPVAEVLAIETEPPATLMGFLPGVALGEITGKLGENDRFDAWSSCGRALRKVHEIGYPAGSHGTIVGETLRPEAPSWGHWMMYNLLFHAEELHTRGEFSFDLARLRTMAERAVDRLNGFRPSLLHNDPQAWNVLVHRIDGRWQCSGWLDWEFAWVGDPAWDLTRLDLWRMSPIGPTPKAVWEGYGAAPPEPQHSFYRMSLMLWQANEHLTHPTDEGLPMRFSAVEYLGELDRHVAAVAEQLAS